MSTWLRSVYQRKAPRGTNRTAEYGISRTRCAVHAESETLRGRPAVPPWRYPLFNGSHEYLAVFTNDRDEPALLSNASGCSLPRILQSTLSQLLSTAIVPQPDAGMQRLRQRLHRFDNSQRRPCDGICVQRNDSTVSHRAQKGESLPCFKHSRCPAQSLFNVKMKSGSRANTSSVL